MDFFERWDKLVKDIDTTTEQLTRLKQLQDEIINDLEAFYRAKKVDGC